LLPAGAKVAGRDSHPLKDSALARRTENISYHVAAGNIDKVLLQDLIAAHLAAESDNESLKLRVLNAIENAAGAD
jgi:death-on-curing protein